ncbi:hypothetical protein [Streptomyces sp. NPDC055912]|uniref:hypothetical protein n=1 Tax=Streptomyces sp. NPDC055912 TaxID=3345660 RepID=UPI0035DCF336
MNRLTGCGYQKALQRVKAAADRGQLPAKLDQAGREEAVRMLAEDHTRPAPAAIAVASGPPADAGAPAQQDHQELPVDQGELPKSFTELMVETHRAMEARRTLRDKERYVDAMRAQRDQGLDPYGRPSLPRELVQQVELLLEQTRRLPRSDDPQ